MIELQRRPLTITPRLHIFKLRVRVPHEGGEEGDAGGEVERAGEDCVGGGDPVARVGELQG